ncbi:glycosyltransferase [Streptomyces sp. NPDC093225]|uniref:glycosyltransferase n=1 Tax=Streptomyces sp. NPDC093225 TaxID=3366034 RepID=UPI0037FEBE38
MTEYADPRRDIFFVGNQVDELGGVTTWTHQMARLFTERGHNVHVIGITQAEVVQDIGTDLPYPTTTLYGDKHPGPVPRIQGVHKLNVGRRLQKSRRDEGMQEQAARLSAMFRAAAPGAVVIVTQVWAMEWVVLADTSDVTVIGMSHESFEYTKACSRFPRVQRYYKDVDRMLALTQEDSDLWIRQGLNNASYMPNPLPFMPGEPSPRSEKVVASIGRLADQKGIDMLLDAWAEVAPEHPDWTLRIYGSGEDEEMLRKQCSELGLDSSVEWMGRTSDVIGALHGSSIFVQSSRGEGFPLALMEAMAAGVPCAAFDCAPGVREIINDGEDGLLAALGNTTGLARILSRLMADKELRDGMGDLARERIQRYVPAEIVARWEQLFSFLDR